MGNKELNRELRLIKEELRASRNDANTPLYRAVYKIIDVLRNMTGEDFDNGI